MTDDYYDLAFLFMAERRKNMTDTSTKVAVTQVPASFVWV